MTAEPATASSTVSSTVSSTASSTVQVLVPARAIVGEGPVVSADGRTVHWVDIFSGRIHTTDVATGVTTTLQVPTLVGAVAIAASGGFVAATREGFATISATGDLAVRAPILPPGSRMNDAKCDAAGRFWAGSTAMDFAAGAGALHVLAPDWTVTEVLTGLTLPNGLGWSPDGGTFYLVDSLQRTLTAFDVDPSVDAGAATLSRARVLREFPAGGELPDGLAVSDDGDLWIAMWGGGRIVRLSSTGEFRQSIDLPVVQPSSCAFAGPDGDQLLITSARQGLDRPDDAPDGSLLMVSGPLLMAARAAPSRPFAG